MKKFFSVMLGLFLSVHAFAAPITPTQLIAVVSARLGSQASPDGYIHIQGHTAVTGAACSARLQANGKQIAITLDYADVNGNEDAVISLHEEKPGTFSLYSVTHYESTPSEINFSLRLHINGFWGKTDWGWPKYYPAVNEDSSAAISLNDHNEVSALAIDPESYPNWRCIL